MSRGEKSKKKKVKVKTQNEKIVKTDMDTGVIHKLRTLRFCNFRFPLSHCTYTKAFSLHPSPLVRTYKYYLLEKIWQRYHYYQSKNHKQHYKIKKLLCKIIGKCRIKRLRRTLGIKLVKSAKTNPRD